MEFRWQYTCSTNWKHHPYNTKTGGSRSVEIHEKVIGTFIEKHMFY
ncbi:Transposase [Shigella dysenteriae 1617]|uniref:Transposase n=1 Tax=Shigella dysenteriae 1617 TaxID=754093 RepID=A0A0A6ZZ06_SHIDY|nr:Transposase [Shigella dysenteriae 1617]